MRRGSLVKLKQEEPSHANPHGLRSMSSSSPKEVLPKCKPLLAATN